MSKKYLQNGKWPGLQQEQTVKLTQVEGDIEIDVDIEKQSYIDALVDAVEKLS